MVVFNSSLNSKLLKFVDKQYVSLNSNGTNYINDLDLPDQCNYYNIVNMMNVNASGGMLNNFQFDKNKKLQINVVSPVTALTITVRFWYV